jgi:hypothetical protein
MNIIQQLKNTGSTLCNHCSDIYIQVTPKTIDVINNYEYKQNVTKFTCAITGDLMFEIPFVYDYKKLGDIK